MNNIYKINCSFAEIIDKLTILNIKKNNINLPEKLININNEIKLIYNDISLNLNDDELFISLYNINYKLWNYENQIREKSYNKIFDNEYINISENIRLHNQKRHSIKKDIDIKYNSYITEEKLYNYNLDNNNLDNNNLDNNNLDNNNYNNIDKLDYNLLNISKEFHTNGNYILAFTNISKLILKYSDSNYINQNIAEIFVTGHIIYNKLGYNNDYIINKLEYLINNIDKYKNNFNNQFLLYIYNFFAIYCLSNKEYVKSYNFLNYYQYITGPNINYNNMSFFKTNDINKTLFLYDSGGIGDKIMFSRLIYILSEKYNNNNILLLLPNEIKWLFKISFKNIKNLNIITIDELYKITDSDYNYHCNLISLLKYLNLEYKDITFYPLFKNLTFNYNLNYKQLSIKNTIVNNSKKSIIFNWKGNDKNIDEKYNRKMPLNYAIPLFKLTQFNWIVITKNITSYEKKILEKYNINYYGDVLDNCDNAFYESIPIISLVDLVITTDTCIAHLSSNLNIKTFICLTIGREWRWTNDNFTNWYPEAKLFIQNYYNNWSFVINNIITELRIL